MARRRVSAAFIAAISLAAAQNKPSARPEFEVASVKHANEQSPTTWGVGADGAGGRNVTLKVLIALAYLVQDYQILGGPRWIGSDQFDVEGRAGADVGIDQSRLMLQALLADRFELKFHRETKQGPVYALVVAKGGPKIKLNPDQTSPDVNGPSPTGAGPNRGATRLGPGSMISTAVTLERWTKMLSQRLERTVIDRTNLTGRYDLRLQWTPDLGENTRDPNGNVMPAAPPSDGRTSIFTAIQEQLGLKLESARGPVEVLVIDHAERPSQN